MYLHPGCTPTPTVYIVHVCAMHLPLLCMNGHKYLGVADRHGQLKRMISSIKFVKEDKEIQHDLTTITKFVIVC